MSKVHRNDPCPCGSGKKYKRCCLPVEQERARSRADARTLVQRAVEWLGQRHGEAVTRWVEEVWFADVSDEERQGLATADPALRSVHDSNVLEYMVTEGAFEVDGESVPVLQLVLDSDLALNDAQREWLSRLAAAPLRLYRVARLEAGQGFWLAPHPEGGDEVRIEDRWTSRMLDEGDVVGLRLAENLGAWETSGAVYYIPSEYVDALLAELEGKQGADYSRTLARYWLGLVAAHV